MQPYAVDAGVILGTSNFACIRKALNLESSVTCQNLFDRIVSVPTVMDYGLILILFYALTLTELRKEQSNKIHTMLSYLGVSRSDYLLAWIVLHFVLSILWGTICCAGYFVKMGQLSSSISFVWLFVVANNFATALFALLCSKFVKGVIWFLAFILQMVLVYFIVTLMSLNQGWSIRLIFLVAKFDPIKTYFGFWENILLLSHSHRLPDFPSQTFLSSRDEADLVNSTEQFSKNNPKKKSILMSVNRNCIANSGIQSMSRHQTKLVTLGVGF